MSATDVLLPAASLLFVVVFGGSAAYYLGGEGAVPRWFIRLGLGLKRPASSRRRAFAVLTCAAFMGLAEVAVLVNLNGPAPLPAILLAEQCVAVAWLIYLGICWGNHAKYGEREPMR
jgi:hypothetical protein